MKKLSRKEETACENATYEIDVRKGFQLAGFYFSVEAEHSNCKGLARNNNLGTCDSGTKEIKIETGYGPTQTSETFIHEILEAITWHYLRDKLRHEDLVRMSLGLHQVMESLGVRFVIRERKE